MCMYRYQHANILPTFAVHGTNKQQKHLLRTKTTNSYILNGPRHETDGRRRLGVAPLHGGPCPLCVFQRLTIIMISQGAKWRNAMERGGS